MARIEIYDLFQNKIRISAKCLTIKRRTDSATKPQIQTTLKNHLLEFIELKRDAADYLENHLDYALKTICEYERKWKLIQEFMYANKIETYNGAVGKKFLEKKFNGRKKGELERRHHDYFTAVRMLDEYCLTKRINYRKAHYKYPLDFEGPIGEKITECIAQLTIKGKSRSTLHSHQRVLSDLNEYCKIEKVGDVKQIDLAFLLKYLNQLYCPYKTNMALAVTALRGFTTYLYRTGHHNRDLTTKIPSVRIVSRAKISSVYTEEEIRQLLNSVDRATPLGKRNYLSIVLACRLGLRASDISNLKFQNIDWENNTIEIIQIKNNRELILPLLSEVGNAIIDYVQNGRGPSKEREHILLLARPPYGKFTNSNTVTHIVQRAIIKAGLRTENRKFGPHALRHSLGYRMLQDRTSINVITEVFGHGSQESSRYYLRIDMKAMAPCALEVPAISSRFYTQKGGFFYE